MASRSPRGMSPSSRPTPTAPRVSSPIGPDGSYSLQTRRRPSGAQLGEYKVAITDIDPEVPEPGHPQGCP